MRQGSGKLTLLDGSVLEGFFNDGTISGKGSILYSNGDKYVGELLNNNIEGQGTKKFAWVGVLR